MLGWYISTRQWSKQAIGFLRLSKETGYDLLFFFGLRCFCGFHTNFLERVARFDTKPQPPPPKPKHEDLLGSCSFGTSCIGYVTVAIILEQLLFRMLTHIFTKIAVFGAMAPRQPIKMMPGQSYVYQYSGRLVSGIAQLDSNAAVLEIKSDIVLQPEQDGRVAMQVSSNFIYHLPLQLFNYLVYNLRLFSNRVLIYEDALS